MSRSRSLAVVVSCFVAGCGAEPDAAPGAATEVDPVASAIAVVEPPAPAASPTETPAAMEELDALDDLGEAETARVAEWALTHEDPMVRARALGVIGDQEGRLVSDTLVAALRDPEATVVVAALEELEWRDEARAYSEIERLLHAPSPAVARAARETLDTLDPAE